MWRKPNGHWRGRSSKTRIRAPIDGVVLQVDAKKGEMALPTFGSVLLIMGDLSALRVRAEVDQQYLGKIWVGNLLWFAPPRLVAVTLTERFCPSPASSVNAINLGDPQKFNDVDVLEVILDLSDPGPLVVGEQVDVYFKSGRAETQ